MGEFPYSYPDLQVLPQVSGSIIDDAVISLVLLLSGNSCTGETEFSFVQPGVAFGEVLAAFSVAVFLKLPVAVHRFGTRFRRA